MYQDVSQNYRLRNRPALIAGAVCGLALLLAVATSFLVAYQPWGVTASR